MNIYALWPELRLIDDRSKREKVREVWAADTSAAADQAPKLLKAAFTKSIANCGVSFVAHKRMVARLAYRTAREYQQLLGKGSVNADDVVSGALLMDIGKVLESTPQYQGRHHASISRALASRLGVCPVVLHVIEAHTKRYRGHVRSLEARIVRDVDLSTYYAIKSDLTKQSG